MFTGIVAGMGRISHIESKDVIRIVIDFGMVSTEGLVAVDPKLINACSYASLIYFVSW